MYTPPSGPTLSGITLYTALFIFKFVCMHIFMVHILSIWIQKLLYMTFMYNVCVCVCVFLNDDM